MNNKKSKIAILNTILLYCFFFFITLFFSFGTANASSLFISPSSGQYNIGEEFSLNINVSSPDQYINAASGVISFPADKLEVTSISKDSSIFTFWVQEPNFSNTLGNVNFEGVSLNLGFTGLSGKMIALKFKVKAAGIANVDLSSGTLLANDGKGSNILTSLGSAKFTLGNKISPDPNDVEKKAISQVSTNIPSSPKIFSLTHPNQNKWYSLKDAKFNWIIPDDILSVKTLVGRFPVVDPTVEYSPAISEKEVPDLEDGVWYFHVQFKNENGWGESSHFKFQIDTVPPEPFIVRIKEGNMTENLQPTLILDAKDLLSGIDYYKVKINEEDFIVINSELVKNNEYILSLQNSGKKTILVQAYDKAGNNRTVKGEFEILGEASPVVEKKVDEKTSFLNTKNLLIAFVFLILFIIFIFWRQKYYLIIFKKRLKKEVCEAKYVLEENINLIKDDLREQEIINEKTLSKQKNLKEKQEIENLKKDLDNAEKKIKKEIIDVDRELE